MRALPFLLLLILALSARPALAGPWPRQAGQTYVFTEQELTGNAWTGFYLERGLPRDLTFGLDVGGHAMTLASADPDRPSADGRVRAFLRIPVLSAPDRRAGRPGWAEPWLAAVEVGIGPEIDPEDGTPLRYGAGLTLGRPLETRLGPGWTTIDLRATVGGGRGMRLNAGLVAGAKPTERLTVELGLYGERVTRTSWTVAPTVEYRLGDFGGARLGVSFKGDGQRLLRVGFARTF